MKKIEGALRKATFPMRHPRRWVERRRGYWQLRSFMSQKLRRLVPAPIKNGVRSAIDWSRNRIDHEATHRVQAANDSYASLTLLPKLSKAECAALPKAPGGEDHERRADVVCFSIIPWTFRFQRPQQIMSQFASRGHRVFYIDPTRVVRGNAKPGFSFRQIKENVYELTLPSEHPRDIFTQGIEGKDLDQTLSALDELRHSYDINHAIAYVMVSSWTAVAIEAQRRWGWLLVYDCMDDWENFPLIKSPLLEAESRLVKSCDLLVVTAQRLIDKWRHQASRAVLARNAVDFDFYQDRCRPNDRLATVRHPVVGYFGAIAEWFDVALVTRAARQRPDYTFVLLGGVFDIDVSELRTLPNVQFLGQRPYETMPEYLYHFDVCIIPFKLNSITQATDPVKLYEYLSAGKPVVATQLHEVETYAEYVYLARDAEDFVTKLDVALAENDDELVARRRELARRNTWADRYHQILEGLIGVVPRTSIIIVTYNNLLLTHLCLTSVIRNTQYLNYEVIIVDNASQDGTPDHLRHLARNHNHVSMILNEANLGFATANNQGIARATGEYIVLLNNDTIVPPGWLSRLLWHLRDPGVGLVGPVTNAIGNEARIKVPYQTWRGMESFAHLQAWSHDRQVADIHMLAMYCVALRRETYDEIGPLDEQFGVGMFEDDDYSIRVRGKGYRVICAADVYVHHFGQAAFGKLIRTGEYDSIFEENRRRFEAKWDITWKAHLNAPLKLALHEFDANSKDRQ